MYKYTSAILKLCQPHLHSVVVDKLLRKVINHAFDPAPKTFGATRFAWFYLAAYLMSFALCAYPSMSVFRGAYQSEIEALTGTRLGNLRRCRSTISHGGRTTSISLRRRRIEAGVVGGPLHGRGGRGGVHLLIGTDGLIGDAPVVCPMHGISHTACTEPV